MLGFLIFILVVAAAQTKNRAILLSSSLGFYNYRQGSNVVKMYHHLKERGFRDEDILLMLPENGKCSFKNSKLGSLSFYDGDHTDMARNFLVDYRHS